MLCTDTPFVLDHHEADTAGRCSIQFGIVEPALHVDVSLVLKCPLCSGLHTNPDSHEVGCEGQRNGQEGDDTAKFCPTGKLVEEDEAQKDHNQHSPLRKGMLSVNLKKHN